MQTETLRLTYEDYVLIPEDGRRHEIIDGDEVVSPSPRTKHQRLVGRLFAALDHYARQHGLGEVFVAPFDVILSDHDIVQPDVLFITDDRLGIVDEVNCKGAPDLVVEVLSESTRRTDLIRKRKLYERVGVADYWIVDPAIDTLQVFRLMGDRYERAAELSMENDGVLTTPLLPGIALRLATLFG